MHAHSHTLHIVHEWRDAWFALHVSESHPAGTAKSRRPPCVAWPVSACCASDSTWTLIPRRPFLTTDWGMLDVQTVICGDWWTQAGSLSVKGRLWSDVMSVVGWLTPSVCVCVHRLYLYLFAVFSYVPLVYCFTLHLNSEPLCLLSSLHISDMAPSAHLGPQTTSRGVRKAVGGVSLSLLAGHPHTLKNLLNSTSLTQNSICLRWLAADFVVDLMRLVKLRSQRFRMILSLFQLESSWSITTLW